MVQVIEGGARRAVNDGVKVPVVGLLGQGFPRQVVAEGLLVAGLVHATVGGVRVVAIRRVQPGGHVDVGRGVQLNSICVSRAHGFD